MINDFSKPIRWKFNTEKFQFLKHFVQLQSHYKNYRVLMFTDVYCARL